MKLGEEQKESRDMAAKLARVSRERDTLQHKLQSMAPQFEEAQVRGANMHVRKHTVLCPEVRMHMALCCVFR